MSGDLITTIYYYPNGVMRELRTTHRITRLRHGPRIHYYENGMVESMFTYKDDKAEGELRGYTVDGRLERYQVFANGKCIVNIQYPINQPENGFGNCHSNE